jgi:hypothetical protein
MTTLTRPGGFARQRIDTAVHPVANEETRAACRASWSSTQQHCSPGGQIRTGREWNARVNGCTVTDGHDYKETRHGHADMTTAPPSCGPDKHVQGMLRTTDAPPHASRNILTSA